MNILSLFDGLGGAKIALDRLGIPCKYYASEIDKYAIKIAQKNYPDIIQLGDIKNIKAKDLSKIDLLIGGSPCQNLSWSGNNEGLKGEQSKLFYEYVRLLKELRPKYFVLENVNSMKKTDKQIITETLAIEPIIINSASLTAQNRKRLYWTNILNISQPEDKHIYLKDIVENIILPKTFYFKNQNKIYLNDSFIGKQKDKFKIWLKKKKIIVLFTPKEIDVTEKRIATRANRYRMSHIKGLNSKSRSLSAHCDITNSGGTGIFINGIYRRLTPLECERLQGLPDNYTQGVSNTQRYKMIGNGFTIPIIVHILKEIK